jgi:hypothetical protein
MAFLVFLGFPVKDGQIARPAFLILHQQSGRSGCFVQKKSCRFRLRLFSLPFLFTSVGSMSRFIAHPKHFPGIGEGGSLTRSETLVAWLYIIFLETGRLKARFGTDLILI